MPVNTATRQRSSPFVHKFETDGSKYIYDVNTSCILRVDSTIWDIIDFVGVLSPEQFTAQYATRHSSQEIADACENIANRQRQDGLLAVRRPEQIPIPYDQKQLSDLLSAKRTQLILNVTDACNFRCSYCVYGGRYEQHRTHSRRMMTWPVARAAIDEFLNNTNDSQMRVVSFYGGEPLINLSLIKRCVTYVREDRGLDDVQFALTINGSLLAGKAAELLASEQFSVLVSLDGPASVHDRYRRYVDGLPTWDDVMSNLRDFLQRHPEYRSNGKLGFTAVLSPPVDLNELREFFQGYDLFTETMNLNVSIVNAPGGPNEQAAISEQMRASGMADLYEEFIASLIDGTFQRKRNSPAGWLEAGLFERPLLLLHKRTYYEPRLPDRFCPLSTCVAGLRRVLVTVDGDYYPCERTPESEYMKIGNVYEGVSIRQVKKMLEDWVAFSAEDCRQCWCLPICSVGCFADVNEEGKLTPEAKRRECEQHRQSMHKTIVDYCRILERNPKAFDYMAAMTIT